MSTVLVNRGFTDIIAINTLIATVSARIGSSIINFIFNYKYVFNGASKKSLFKYYILWFVQLGASYGITILCAQVGHLEGWQLTLAKAGGDLFLALISYQVQCNWVFKKKYYKNKFHGGFAKIGKFFFKLFSKSYRVNVIENDEPVIYVCRHINMHGPFTVLKWLPFDVHPMVLNVFFTQKESYKQYTTYTFSERVGKKKGFSFKAWISSIFVPKMVKSLGGVPVYRNSNQSIKTFKSSMDVLMKGESVVIFPDIDYTASYDTISDIYSGFLFIGELYKKKTGKDLKFVPLYIDDENKKIEEREPIVVNNFREEEISAKEYLIKQINKIEE